MPMGILFMESQWTCSLSKLSPISTLDVTRLIHKRQPFEKCWINRSLKNTPDMFSLFQNIKFWTCGITILTVILISQKLQHFIQKDLRKVLHFDYIVGLSYMCTSEKSKYRCKGKNKQIIFKSENISFFPFNHQRRAHPFPSRI